MSRDRKIDAYIAKSPDFAKPILEYFREAVHAAVPDIEETVKWSAPAFYYKGPLAGMAGFKKYCAFHFWKAPLLGLPHDQFAEVRSIDDLPPQKDLIALLKKAARLNDDGVKVVRKRLPKPEAKTPPDLAAALKKNKKAAAAYESFSPSHRREYVEWITEAKSEETRQRRLDQAIEWIAEGKSRNWKYEKK